MQKSDHCPKNEIYTFIYSKFWGERAQNQFTE